VFFALMLLFCVSIGSGGLIKRRLGQGTVETPTNVAPAPINLDFRPEPMKIFDGKISINFPAIASEIKPPDPKRQFAMTVVKPGTKSPDMNVVLSLVQVRPWETLQTTAERLTTSFKEQHKLSDSFVWRTVQGQREALITQPVFHSTAPVYVHVMWGLVQFDSNQVILITVNLFSQDAAERSAYAACAQKIVESIQINNPPKP
jgi:hypothetical protein